MSNLVLQCKESKEFIPHPEGIHPAVCVDVIDLGLVESEFQGQRRMLEKVKVVFESEQILPNSTRCTVTKEFTASLHPKSRLADFLGKWRGRPVFPNESIDLQKLLGACCTLVISHQQNMSGKTYASIDAISKPTKKIAASGQYDPAAARQRIAEWKAKQAKVAAPLANAPMAAKPNAERGVRSAELPVATATHTSSGQRPPSPQSGEGHKSPAPVTAPPAFDPEVGF